MQSESSVSPEVLERAKELALECEQEQRPNHIQTWNELPDYLRLHWIEKAQRADFKQPSKK